MKSLYLLIDFFTIIIPFLFSFHPKIQFYKTWKAFFPATIIVAIVFIMWDALFTHLGVWNFNPAYVAGIYILNLPIEEILFFICIPYSCVFTYYCLDRFYRLAWNRKTENYTVLFFSSILLIMGIWNLDKLYTSATFISTAFVCLILQFIVKIDWMGKVLTVYAILIIPFLVVNGILTGTGIEEPVVRYNNRENLQFRLFTIPVEDVFYGFTLIVLNIWLYKILLRIINKKTAHPIEINQPL